MSKVEKAAMPGVSNGEKVFCVHDHVMIRYNQKEWDKQEEATAAYNKSLVEATKNAKTKGGIHLPDSLNEEERKQYNPFIIEDRADSVTKKVFAIGHMVDTVEVGDLVTVREVTPAVFKRGEYVYEAFPERAVIAAIRPE